MGAAYIPAAPRRAALAGLALVVAALAGCGEAPAPGAERSDPREHEITAAMIKAIKAVSRERHPDGIMKRFNQAKSLGCFDARFEVPQGLPEPLRQGLFADAASYPARLRFANASESDDREKDFRGLSIKVTATGAETLWGAPGVHDFLLNSHPALLAGTPQEFLDFIEATRDGALWKFFVKPWNWDSLLVVLRGRERIDSPFAIRYWSTTPFRYGDDAARAVKYSTRPCADAPAAPVATPACVSAASRLAARSGVSCGAFATTAMSSTATAASGLAPSRDCAARRSQSASSVSSGSCALKVKSACSSRPDCRPSAGPSHSSCCGTPAAAAAAGGAARAPDLAWLAGGRTCKRDRSAASGSCAMSPMRSPAAVSRAISCRRWMSASAYRRMLLASRRGLTAA